jgi:toxin-antitoxin system PIN domain toxin
MAGRIRIALLDVNVLIALFDAAHLHHELAHDWFADQRPHGWATCPVTENGFIRIVSNPASGREGLRPAAAASRLRQFLASGHHTFWPGSVSAADDSLFDLSVASGHRQVTDLYLLGLAVRMKGCLATFDRTIPLQAVTGATPAAIQIIGAAD